MMPGWLTNSRDHCAGRSDLLCIVTASARSLEHRLLVIMLTKRPYQQILVPETKTTTGSHEKGHEDTHKEQHEQAMRHVDIDSIPNITGMRDCAAKRSQNNQLESKPFSNTLLPGTADDWKAWPHPSFQYIRFHFLFHGPKLL